MLHSRNRVGLYCSPGTHGRLDREAWWAKGQACEVVAAYGVDPAIFIGVIEGLLHPGDMQEEGALGEFTGYYGNPRAPQPIIEVKALHWQNKPVLTTALIARAARVLDDLDRIGLPGVPYDLNQVLWALSTRCNPIDDLEFLRSTWSTGLDSSQYPPENRPYGSNVLINACRPHRYMRKFPAATRLRRSTYENILKRWPEFAFGTEPPHLSVFHDAN